ncbi:hypothetical protein FB451DRAFT_1281717 [Mycena latifolia]|nr:hypothetical protein FB451DRAFT_1281717 [Mycena latifolia]
MAAQPTLDFVRYTAEGKGCSTPTSLKLVRHPSTETAKLEEVTAGPARALLLQSGLLPQPPPTAVVLDNASGPGVLTTVLFNTIGTDSGVKIVCTDLAEPLIKAAVTRIQVNGWNAEAKVADSRNSPSPTRISLTT